MPRFGFNSGLMGARRIPTTGSASGVWNWDEQSVAKRAGIWPVTGGILTRYLRLANFSNDTSPVMSTLDLGEIVFYDDDTILTGISVSASFDWAIGFPGQIVDGYWYNRVARTDWGSYRATATVSFDFGSVRRITHMQAIVFGDDPAEWRWPGSVDLQTSTDGSNYSTLSTLQRGNLTVDTNYGLPFKVTPKYSVS